MALNPPNSGNLDQLALKGLKRDPRIYLSVALINEEVHKSLVVLVFDRRRLKVKMSREAFRAHYITTHSLVVVV